MQRIGFFKWLTEIGEERKEKRCQGADIVAFYWNGTVPTSHKVKDISRDGAFLLTGDRWYVGTLLMITLQCGVEVTDPEAAVAIACRVVRHGTDGVGVNFMPTGKKERQALRRLIRSAANATAYAYHPGRGASGQAIVEYALMVPLLFLLIVNAFNFCGFIYCWLTVADAVRAAADYASEDSSTATSPATPSVTAITTLVQNATAGLPDYSTSNPTVTVCENNNGTVTTFGSTSGCPAGVANPPADPESSALYATVAVDVTYTFSPLIAGSAFLRFGLPALPSTIHRRIVVRFP